MCVAVRHFSALVAHARPLKNMAASSAFPDKARVLKLAEQIQARLAHAQQVKLSGQQPVNPQVFAPPECMTDDVCGGHVQGHVAQAEEIQRRLTEAVLRLQDAARGEPSDVHKIVALHTHPYIDIHVHVHTRTYTQKRSIPRLCLCDPFPCSLPQTTPYKVSVKGWRHSQGN